MLQGVVASQEATALSLGCLRQADAAPRRIFVRIFVDKLAKSELQRLVLHLYSSRLDRLDRALPTVMQEPPVVTTKSLTLAHGQEKDLCWVPKVLLL